METKECGFSGFKTVSYTHLGRTYRYMTQEPLFPFCHGFSYTSFSYGAVVLGSDNIKSGEKLRLSVPVRCV